MSKKLLFGVLLSFGWAVILQQAASAHVLIGDDTHAIGAVLHIVPDDDPIAGQQSSLFFDVQIGKIDPHGTKLLVTNTANGETSAVPIKVSANAISADYTFPTQGVYQLSLTVGADKPYIFHYAQRVSRGTAGSVLDSPTYPLATMALVFCGTLFLCLLIVMLTHRKEIWRHSTF